MFDSRAIIILLTFFSKNNKYNIKNYSTSHNHTNIIKNILQSLISILKSIIIPFSLFFNLWISLSTPLPLPSSHLHLLSPRSSLPLFFFQIEHNYLLEEKLFFLETEGISHFHFLFFFLSTIINLHAKRNVWCWRS